MATIFSDNWLELVFQGRNQDYGAYDLRKRTPRNSVLAVGIALSTLGTAVVTPIIINMLHGHKVVVDTSLIIDGAHEIETITPPVASPPAPKAMETPAASKATSTFTVPVIVDDHTILDETPKAQDDFKNTEPGKTNGGGEGGSGLVPSDIGKGNGDATETKDEPPFSVVEIMPEFNGGDKALLTYLASNTNYPAPCKENGVEGTVYVQFVVEKTGKIDRVKVLRSVDKFLDKEAVRVVSSMPNWKPGKQNGREVAVYYTVPIRFVLQ